MKHPVLSRSVWCAFGAVLLLGSLGAPLSAQSPDDATVLVQQTYTLIRDEALRPPDAVSVLRAALAATQQALQTAGVQGPPTLPVLSGREAEDVEAAVSYIQTAVRTLAPRPTDGLVAMVLRAMVRTVRDPQGAAFTPPEFDEFTQLLRGEYAGIGAQIDFIGGVMVVVELTEGGPAVRAGLRVGDVLLEVDGQPVEGRRPDQVLNTLRGRAGVDVLLTVRRDDEVKRFPIARERVREIPVRAKMLDTRIGYLRLLEFSENAGKDTERALARLVAMGAQALVLDLRENEGGLVEEAVLVTSAFLTRGAVAIEEGRKASVTLLVRPVSNRFAGHLIVLVNGFTASASEIVAGALQDAGISLVGARTFGKGTVQTIFSLPAGWGLRLTTARFRTRNGRQIDGIGLTPEFVVATAIDQIQGPGDLQLETAHLVLKRRLETGPP